MESLCRLFTWKNKRRTKGAPPDWRRLMECGDFRNAMDQFGQPWWNLCSRAFFPHQRWAALRLIAHALHVAVENRLRNLRREERFVRSDCVNGRDQVAHRV